MAAHLRVIEDHYDLLRYLVGRVEKFPRHHRYNLGADVERRLQAILALLIRSQYAPANSDKAAHLRSINVELEVLRFQVRLARDLALLSNHCQQHALERIRAIGVLQVGGWLRSLRS